MNICTRCGKQRIVISSYEEKIEKSSVVYTITACSDPDCQKMVDADLKKEEIKRTIMRNEQEKRAQLKAAQKRSI